MNSLEKRIEALINENKQRKAIFPIAGSLVAFSSNISDTLTRVLGVGGGVIILRVKFACDASNAAGLSMTTMTPQVATDAGFTARLTYVGYYNEPQIGDGSVVLNIRIIHYSAATVYIRAIATGPSRGVFTII